MRVYLAFLILFCLASAGLPRPAFAASFGQVVAQEGSVIAFRQDSPLALHIGARLEVGDRIVTGAASRLRIGLPDGSTFSLGAETDITLSALESESGFVSLLFGILRSSLSSERQGGFEVRTPSAVASVRSTDWIVEVLEHKSAVFVVDGRVAVTDEGASGQVVLDPGFGTDVPQSGQPSTPKQWGAPRVEEAIARTALP